ncbi:amino acid permease [Amycolatopsis acidicola]|uniref:Amino acid permease n=1 Tax=Amycolatopsis acidicola TaxID=2596893 RepID=A0A5N0V9C1_9PSEU|nr:amino acid permease [Amycolatopsis acidicola]KAA9162605.1 amino acid permease [Amycolatopsis acidicola]
MPSPSLTTRRRRRVTDDVAASTLKRRLGRFDLTAMGVGSIVGAGIFVTTGVVAATKTGPSIVLSFLLAGVVCVLVALCYGELAAMVPASGSAYTYTYATLGETPAFLVGWNVLLELVVAGSAVAIGWSGMFNASLESLFGVSLPHALTASPSSGGVVNLPAMLIIAVVVAILAAEVRLTARVTKVLVTVTVAVLVVIVAIGAPHVQAANWADFAPFGAGGVVGGAAMAFFAYLGFDVVATSAEEAKNPRRDLPFAIIASVIIATVLYIAVSAVLTGVAPYQSLNNEAPVATAFKALHLGWTGGLILAASVVALTKGLLIVLYGQSRLVFAMCRDRLLPPALAKTNRNGMPLRATLVLGLVGMVFAGFVPIDIVAELVNVGALFAFAVVAAGVLVLRRTEPERDRPFRTPWVPVVPVLALVGCIVLATTLAPLTWLRFGVWLIAGIVLYLGYGRRHSVLAEEAR